MGGIDIDLNAPYVEEIEMSCEQPAVITTNLSLEANFVNVNEDGTHGHGSTNVETPSRKSTDKSCKRRLLCKKRKKVPKSGKQAASKAFKPWRYWRDIDGSKGEEVKKANKVIKMRFTKSLKGPNLNCSIEAFGRICKKFDELRLKWVKEMGFGGLLYLVDIKLPCALCYWLMTRIDPFFKWLRLGDTLTLPLSKIQVCWILGILCEGKQVPRKVCRDEMPNIVSNLENKYGKRWQGTMTKKVFSSTGILITPKMLEKVEGKWEENEEEEFKTLFLLLSLHLVLCPTKGPRMERDLVSAATCAMTAKEYDWSALVLDKFLASVTRFGQSFYADGYADEVDGCSIYIALFYLDKLNRNPVRWGERPRVKAWKNEDIQYAIMDDILSGGDFGKRGCVDSAYGERHLAGARDTMPPYGSHQYYYKVQAPGRVRRC